MNRPSPSLAILAVVAVVLALIFFGRQYLWPAHHVASAGRAAFAGYSHPTVAQALDQDAADTVAGITDAGRMWAKAHHPNNAAVCPAFPIPFHAGCVQAASGRPR